MLGCLGPLFETVLRYVRRGDGVLPGPSTITYSPPHSTAPNRVSPSHCLERSPLIGLVTADVWVPFFGRTRGVVVVA